MEKSESIKSIAAALGLFHQKIGTIKRDATNPFFKKKYASLSNILDAIQKPLDEAGLVFSQFPSGDNGLTTILIHAESGEYLQSDYIMVPAKNDPQGKGSAITYQRRYALSAALGLNIDDDDDGNAASTPAKQSKQANQELPWLNESMPEFAGAVSKLKSGTSSIQALRKYFQISKQIEAELIKQSQAA